MSLTNVMSRRRRPRAAAVLRPSLRALRLPLGAPEPLAPPCMRQRALPAMAGDWQGLPERVRAPQRRLASIGPVLRRWVLMLAGQRRRRERTAS